MCCRIVRDHFRVTDSVIEARENQPRTLSFLPTLGNRRVRPSLATVRLGGRGVRGRADAADNVRIGANLGGV